jgi:Mrp family chromosome partitioning ATPase
LQSDVALSRNAPEGRGTNKSLQRRLTANRVTSQLYYNIASLRMVNDPIAIQFVASQPSEGTSLVASQFAAFAAGVEGGSALLIDCVTPPQWRSASEQRPTLADVFSKSAHIEPAIAPYELSRNLDGAALSNQPNSILHTDAVALGAVLDQARKRYRVTVLDTPSLEESPGTLAFSRACDAVVLVLEAEKTAAEMAETAIDTIERGGGKVIGLIFNKRRLHMPKWLYRRL